MARMWMARKITMAVDATKRSAVRPLLGAMVVVAAAACSTSGGAAGGSASSAGAAGSGCTPTTQNQGCFNGVRMQCTADATATTGGKWALSGTCAVGEICSETVDPSNAAKRLATCKATGGGSDATTGADGTTAADTTTGADGTTTADVKIIGGDDTGTVTPDTGPAIGSCGDGFCNTGETAANCPADCGTAGPVCGNGTCEKGETKANCPADCGTVAPVCNNNGTCDAGETTANCPADCPASGSDPTACLQANCGTEYNACGSDQACVTLLNCLNACTSATDTACINACASTAGQAAVTEYNNLGNCGTTNNCFSGGGTTSPVCGDGKCDTGETKANCPADCGTTTTTNVCDGNCGNQGGTVGGKPCYCDNQCATYGDCCNAAGTATGKVCTGSTCADCNGGGTTTTPVCGNGTCETGETNATCPADCPAGTKTCTTYADVQAIFQNNCNGCHGHTFGNGCSSAKSYASINSYVQSGQMPQGSSLSAADKATVAAWAAAKNACTTASCP